MRGLFGLVLGGVLVLVLLLLRASPGRAGNVSSHASHAVSERYRRLIPYMTYYVAQGLTQGLASPYRPQGQLQVSEPTQGRLGPRGPSVAAGYLLPAYLLHTAAAPTQPPPPPRSPPRTLFRYDYRQHKDIKAQPFHPSPPLTPENKDSEDYFKPVTYRAQQAQPATHHLVVFPEDDQRGRVKLQHQRKQQQQQQLLLDEAYRAKQQQHLYKLLVLQQEQQEFRAQQEQEIRAQQVKALRAQQEQEIRAQQAKELRAQQEQEIRAQQAKELRAQQEQEIRAQQVQELRAQQEQEIRALQAKELREQIRFQQQQAKGIREQQMRVQQEQELRALQAKGLIRAQEQELRVQHAKKLREQIRLQQEQELRAQLRAEIRAQQHEHDMQLAAQQEQEIQAQQAKQLREQFRAQHEQEIQAQQVKQLREQEIRAQQVKHLREQEIQAQQVKRLREQEIRAQQVKRLREQEIHTQQVKQLSEQVRAQHEQEIQAQQVKQQREQEIRAQQEQRLHEQEMHEKQELELQEEQRLKQKGALLREEALQDKEPVVEQQLIVSLEEAERMLPAGPAGPSAPAPPPVVYAEEAQVTASPSGGKSSSREIVAHLINGLQLSNKLPQSLTPDNFDMSLKTIIQLLRLLHKSKAEAPAPTRVKVSPEAPETDTSSFYISEGSVSQTFPAPNVEGSTPGRPGVDYPAYDSIPQTSFSCATQRYKGFFGDPETNCQVWHYCDLNGGQASFLCPNGTIFSQVGLTCDWWFNVRCASTAQLYVLNERLYKYILPVKPSFPEDFSGPDVDRYLTEKFREMQAKARGRKEKTAAGNATDTEDLAEANQTEEKPPPADATDRSGQEATDRSAQEATDRSGQEATDRSGQEASDTSEGT